MFISLDTQFACMNANEKKREKAASKSLSTSAEPSRAGSSWTEPNEAISLNILWKILKGLQHGHMPFCTFWKFQQNLYGCFRFGNCIYHQVYLFLFFRSTNVQLVWCFLFIFFKWPNAKLFPFLDRNIHNHIKEVSRWMRVDSCFQPCSNTCNVNINDFPQHVRVSCGISCSRDWESIRKVSFNLDKVHTNNNKNKISTEEKKNNLFFSHNQPDKIWLAFYSLVNAANLKTF